MGLTQGEPATVDGGSTLQPPSVPARYDQNMVLVVRAAVRYRGRYDAGLLLEMSPVIIIRKRRVNESV